MPPIILRQFKIVMLCVILITCVLICFQINFEKFNEDINNIRLDRRNGKYKAVNGRNESLILENIVNEIPNLPIEDLINFHHKKHRNINGSCAPHPSLADIHIHNEYWQEFHNTVNITHYIFGAYLDVRPRVVKDEPVVRVLTMANFISTKNADYPKVFCQLWYEEQSAPIIVPTKDLRRIWVYGWGHGLNDNYGHLITCVLPEEHKDWIPKTVSLVSQPCEKASNLMRVTYFPLKDGEVKQGFAVCIKGFDFPYVDLSHRLVEHLETVRSLGATKVIIYNLQAHPNMTKVVKYYEKTEFLEYRPFSFSLKVGNLPHYRHMEMSKNGYAHIKHEVIPYNDCLYRNMYRYDYVTNIDIDEIPMPQGKHNDWYDIIKFGESITSKNCKEYGSFCFRCVTFPCYAEKPRYSDEFPEYFYMLQHVHRVPYHFGAGISTKCLHGTSHIITTHNHMPMHYASDVCGVYTFNATDAQLQHYRPVHSLHDHTVKSLLNATIVDKSLWRFKDEIMERSTKVFSDLDFFDNS